MRMMRVMRIIVLCACFLCVFLCHAHTKKQKWMRIFFCVFLHAHVFLCFFGMRITHMCDAHTKKTQKNTKRHAHEEKHKKICASTFVFLYAHDIKKTQNMRIKKNTKKYAHVVLFFCMRMNKKTQKSCASKKTQNIRACFFTQFAHDAHSISMDIAV